MNLNRRVPVGLPGGVRGRKLFTFSYSILADLLSNKTRLDTIQSF